MSASRIALPLPLCRLLQIAKDTRSLSFGMGTVAKTRIGFERLPGTAGRRLYLVTTIFCSIGRINLPIPNQV